MEKHNSKKKHTEKKKQASNSKQNVSQRSLQSFRKILKYTGVERDRLASLRYDEPLTLNAPQPEPGTCRAVQHSPGKLFQSSPNGTGISSAAGSLL